MCKKCKKTFFGELERDLPGDGGCQETGFERGTEATESHAHSGQAELPGCEAIGNVEVKTPWWRTDKFGWPIETVIGKRLDNFIRVVLQNIRKITG